MMILSSYDDIVACGEFFRPFMNLLFKGFINYKAFVRRIKSYSDASLR